MIHGTKASLLSPNFPATTQKCLSFYYFMAGEGLNTLSVGFKNSDGLKMLWKRVGPQGNRWNHATVNLPAIPGSDNGTVSRQTFIIYIFLFCRRGLKYSNCIFCRGVHLRGHFLSRCLQILMCGRCNG